MKDDQSNIYFSRACFLLHSVLGSSLNGYENTSKDILKPSFTQDTSVITCAFFAVFFKKNERVEISSVAATCLCIVALCHNLTTLFSQKPLCCHYRFEK